MGAKWFVTMIVVASLAAGCGGSDDSSTNTTSGDDTTGVTDPDGDAVPTFDIDLPDAEYTDVDGLTVRFANLYWTGGAGAPIDIYWGPDPTQGEKITTLEYGTVSDYMTGKVNLDSIDPTALTVSFVAEGETEIQSVLMSAGETLGSGDQVTYAFAAADTEIDGHQAGSLQIVHEKSTTDNAINVPEPGQAMLFSISLGLEAIPEPDSDFVQLGTADGCLPDAMVGANGNGGQVYSVDPGDSSVAAFDANLECASDAAATPFVDLTVADGDQVLLLMYGPAKDDRQVVVAPVE